MKYQTSTLFLFSLIIGLAGLVFSINYYADPFCKYRCSQIDIQKYSLNPYYQSAQRILKHSDATQIILGSSRGQTTSPVWLTEASGLKTLNLSIAGANLETKKSLLDFAIKNLKLKKVVWFADYYEFGPTQNELNYVDINALPNLSMKDILRPEVLKTIFDHNTFAASFKILSSSSTLELNQGSGSDRTESCTQGAFIEAEKMSMSPRLQAEINQTYDKYRAILLNPTSLEKINYFSQIVQTLKDHDIQVFVVIPGYHPQFTQKLKSEYPERYQQHLDWKKQITALASDKIIILNFFENENSNEVSSLYWNDGDHFTCRTAAQMLNQMIKRTF